MREILFRGKSGDTNKWAFGDFVSDACGISHEEYLNEYGDIGYIMTCVIPETIGQYTGLTDKNGKKIFEGDVLSVTVNEMTNESDDVLNNLIDMGIYTEADKARTYKIPTGNKVKTVWTVEHKDHFNQGVGFYLYGKDRRFHLKLSRSTLLNVNAEIIGNIHDNPELLKGGENG